MVVQTVLPGSDNRVPDPKASRSGGELVPLRRTIDDAELRLEPPRLEPLTAAQETEATELLAVLFAAASRRAEESPMSEAAQMPRPFWDPFWGPFWPPIRTGSPSVGEKRCTELVPMFRSARDNLVL